MNINGCYEFYSWHFPTPYLRICVENSNCGGTKSLPLRDLVPMTHSYAVQEAECNKIAITSKSVPFIGNYRVVGA